MENETVDNATEQVEGEVAKPTAPPPKPKIEWTSEQREALNAMMTANAKAAVEVALKKQKEDANKTAEQLAAEKLKEREDALAERESQLALEKKQTTATKLLSAKGYDETEIAEMIEDVINFDKDDITAQIDKIHKIAEAKAQRAAAATIPSAAPKASNAGGNVGLTKGAAAAQQYQANRR